MGNFNEKDFNFNDGVKILYGEGFSDIYKKISAVGKTDKKIDQLKNNGERYLELTPGEYEALKNNLILKELKNNSDKIIDTPY